MFSPESTRGEVIVTFLALLELIRLKVVRAVQQERFGPNQLHLAVADLAEAQARAREMGQVGMSAVEEESDDGRPGDQS